MQSDCEIGEIVGLYELMEKLDATGVGQAYRARSLQSGDVHMLRILPPELSEGEAPERFRREVRILRDLDHPNIAAIHKSGHSFGRTFLATELPVGSTLEDLLRDDEPLPLQQGLRYMSDVLAGLECVHQAGVVHRCVAPSNVYVLEDGSAKITGFSFARSDVDPKITVNGLVIGIAGYMAPEQAEGLEIDALSDLYSAAAVLYQVVTGRRPFESKSLFQLIQDHLKAEVPPPADIRPEISDELSRVILKGLAKDRSQRFQSANEFRDALLLCALD